MSEVRKFYVQGYPVLVDQEDWELVASHPYAWAVQKRGRTHYIRSSGASNQSHIYLHRLITGATDSEVIDHISGSALDNRRANLRVGTQFENTQNRRKSSNNKSGFTGVSHRPYLKKPWKAYLYYKQKQYSLGQFAEKEQAALAYNEGVLRILPPEHSKLRKLNVVIGETNETKKVA